jgi:hypothetical protein
MKLLKKIWANLVGSFKRLLKTSALAAAAFTIIAVLPYLLLLLLRPDSPQFSQTFKSLALIWVIGFTELFLFFFILFSLVISIATTIKYFRNKNKETEVTENKSNIDTPETILVNKAETNTNLHSPTKQLISKINLFKILGGISGFLYLMYYIGRAYAVGTFQSLNIPTSFMKFELQDYIFFGAQVDTMFITVMFLAVLVGLPVFGLIRHDVQILKNTFSTKFSLILMLFYFTWFNVIVLLLVYWQIFRPDFMTEKPVIMTALLSCIVTLGFLITTIFFDKETYVRITNGKIKSKLFFTGTAITLLFCPYILGQAWGAFKSQTTFSATTLKFEIVADSVLTDDFIWISTSDGGYKPNQALRLLAKTSEFAFFATSENETVVYAFRLSNILSIKSVPEPNDNQ